jgi:hypothetical protein
MGTLSIDIFPDGKEVWRDIRKTGVVPKDAAAVTTLFTVTGDVIVRLFGICREGCTTSDAITVEVGVSGATAVLLAQVANAIALFTNEIWLDATPTLTLEAVPAGVSAGFIISNGQNIILTPSGTFTAGIIDFYCSWKPLSVDGKVA